MRGYEEGHADPKHWALEMLLVAVIGRTLSLLWRIRRGGVWRRFCPRKKAKLFIDRACHVLAESSGLLSLDNFHVYSQLSRGRWKKKSGSFGGLFCTCRRGVQTASASFWLH